MSGLPDALATAISEGLEARTGQAARIVSAIPVSGGCVNDARIIRTDRGAEFFLKHNLSAPPGLFEAEADGLVTIAAHTSLRVPEVIAHGGGGHPAWLVLEYVPPGRPTASYWHDLGAGLAALHAPRHGPPGYERENFIGPLTQPNEPLADWSDFWVTRRIRPQLERAFAAGLLDSDDRLWTVATRAISRALEARPVAETMSLLHGDFWSGNVYPDVNGRPVLIDPAVYRGDPDVDLAMAELFGGFAAGFYEAYRAVRPVAPGDEEVWRAVYQLYPLLVHANLFGAGYAAAARASAAVIVTRSEAS